MRRRAGCPWDESFVWLPGNALLASNGRKYGKIYTEMTMEYFLLDGSREGGKAYSDGSKVT